MLYPPITAQHRTSTVDLACELRKGHDERIYTFCMRLWFPLPLMREQAHARLLMQDLDHMQFAQQCVHRALLCKSATGLQRLLEPRKISIHTPDSDPTRSQQQFVFLSAYTI